VEKAIDTRSQMGVLGDMQRYQQFQMAQAVTQAAANPGGGGAATGVGLGVGFAMANQVAQGLGLGAQPGAAPPPPPAAAASWHVTENGQSLGPFNLQQLQQGIQQGQVNAQTLVWSAGMAGWTPAGQVPQLAGLFGPPAPPPPPPPPSPKS
jgi:membrane protease subunit (stomatin/prohibitin family)